MIERATKGKDSPYSCISNQPINDSSLSFKALGILVYLLSKPDSWHANIEELTASHNDGINSVRSGVDELVNAGYIKRERVVDKKTKRVTSWQWIVVENPKANPDNDFPDVEKPDVENHHVEFTRENTGEYGNNEPHNDFPQVGFPDVENQTLVNTEYSKYISSNEDATANAAPHHRSGKSEKPKSQKRESTAYVNPTTGFGTDDIFSAYKEVLAEREPGAVINFGMEKAAAKRIAQAGRTPEEVKITFAEMKARSWYADKHLSLVNISTDLAAVVAGRKLFNGKMVSQSTPTYKRIEQL